MIPSDKMHNAKGEERSVTQNGRHFHVVLVLLSLTRNCPGTNPSGPKWTIYTMYFNYDKYGIRLIFANFGKDTHF